MGNTPPDKSRESMPDHHSHLERSHHLSRDMSDAQFATAIAELAGGLLQNVRSEFLDRHHVRAARRLRDEADAASQSFLDDLFTTYRRADAVLSEEAVDDHRRDSADRVWIVDPLDGTWEYGQNRHDWAVHIALWEREADIDSRIVCAAVAVPDDQRVFTSHPAEPLPPLNLDRPCRVVASRNRPPVYLNEMLGSLGDTWESLGGPASAELLNVGSVGAKTARLLTGEADVYVHDSGFYEWDVAAPLAVAQRAGLHVSDIHGRPLELNQRPPYVSNLIICRPELADSVLALVSRHG